MKMGGRVTVQNNIHQIRSNSFDYTINLRHLPFWHVPLFTWVTYNMYIMIVLIGNICLILSFHLFHNISWIFLVLWLCLYRSDLFPFEPKVCSTVLILIWIFKISAIVVMSQISMPQACVLLTTANGEKSRTYTWNMAVWFVRGHEMALHIWLNWTWAIAKWAAQCTSHTTNTCFIVDIISLCWRNCDWLMHWFSFTQK